LEVFWGKKGKGLSLSWGSPFGGLPHIIEKGCRICIPLVQLVPKTRNLSGLKIAVN